MKIYYSCFIVFVFAFNMNPIYGQDGYSDYDKAMISLTEEVAGKIKSNNKIRVGLWGFTDSYGETNDLGDYIRSDFDIHFTNVSEGLEVTNRNDLKQIMKEHQLNEEGLIDASTAKQLGVLNAADAIIIGTVDVGVHNLRLRIKVINTETGIHFAAALRSLPIDENMKAILKDTGFYKPIKSSDDERVSTSENENSQRSTNKKCESLKTGDYCFKNKSNNFYGINVRGIDNKVNRNIRAEQNQDACLFDLPEGTYNFSLYKNGLRNTMGSDNNGSFRIERCKSITYTISE